ncbi:unnamed protein product [Discula destructiva]
MPPSQGLASAVTQMYPPKLTFTEKDVGDLYGKVYIVTGGNSGVGKVLVSLLFAKNAKVYMGARSEAKARSAIAEIKKAHPESKGTLIFLDLDLADLEKVKQSAEKFLSLEGKLHVLFNNAAVMALNDKDGSAKTVQGHERHLGVNVLAHFLFTKLLSPLMVSTAKIEPPNTVRVIWVSSMGLETMGETSKGLSMDYVDYWPAMSPLERYGLSKAGKWLYGVEMARRFRADGLISMPVNPGHLSSELNREGSLMFKTAMDIVANYPCINGACVHLWAAFSTEVTLEKSGQWVIPWGRFYPLREDLVAATKLKDEGGNGHAKDFWDWSEEQVKDFV